MKKRCFLNAPLQIGQSDHRKKNHIILFALLGLFSLTLTGCASKTNVKWTAPLIGGSIGAFLGSQMASGKARFLTIILGTAVGVAGGLVVENYVNKPSTADGNITPLEPLGNRLKNIFVKSS